MFTGLIQARGRVESVRATGGSGDGETRLGIRPLTPFQNVVLGESIAVNGACLSVEIWEPGSGGSGGSGASAGLGAFSAYASAETLARTSLGALRPGTFVNLERALALGDRLGGHLVSGHVDCLARVESITPAGESRRYRLRFPEEFGTQVVAKGSVALDGISLTVNACGADFLEVNIIPATLAETTIASWKPGTQVNMETDLIGKYVERMLLAWREAGQASGQRAGGGLSEAFLREHGF